MVYLLPLPPFLAHDEASLPYHGPHAVPLNAHDHSDFRRPEVAAMVAAAWHWTASKTSAHCTCS
ncbi:hypothetical protein FOA52_002439 [Chlamydomonas sp. UWO 241]|nr:hypothetical protein FOA52_002439 [Chlamydomonas sp. UWO 241]